MSEIARSALAKGISLELIHDITGLDTETIKSKGMKKHRIFYGYEPTK